MFVFAIIDIYISDDKSSVHFEIKTFFFERKVGASLLTQFSGELQSDVACALVPCEQRLCLDEYICQAVPDREYEVTRN